MATLKRLLDVLLSCVAILLLFPVTLLIAAAIKLDSPGPVLFKQGRLGLHGRVFTMLKFRTMTVAAETMGTGLFSYEDDPRVTRVGRFLRQFSLDEIPQFFNVLRGDMSIVGPRPPVTYELGPYSEFTSEMKVRFTVKPGITGMAQVSGRNDLAWPDKIRYDNEYVARYRRLGILEDIRLLVKTVFIVLSGRGVIEKPKNGMPT